MQYNTPRSFGLAGYSEVLHDCVELMARREPIALRSRPWSRNLGLEHYPFSYGLTGWLCSEVGTTRYSPVADVPRRSRRLNNCSFHYTSVLVSSTRFLSETCLTAPSRLAL